MLFRSGRQHLERRIRHGRFSRPLAPLAASQTVEAVSPCCRYSRAGTRCLGREAGRDFGAEARPAKAANSGLGETAAWRTRAIDRGCRPVPVGSRLLWTPGIRGRFAMERNGPSAPDVLVIVARPTTAPILSRAASPEHAIERACALRHSPGCRPKPWGWDGRPRALQQPVSRPGSGFCRAGLEAASGSQAQHRWPARPTKARRNCLRQRQPQR